MKRVLIASVIGMMVATTGAYAARQAKGQGIAGLANDVMKKVDLMTFTQEEEEQLGAKVSELCGQLATRVVQDTEVHRIRHARRPRVVGIKLPSFAAVDVHRPRYRRCQRVRARRVRPHHQGRTGADAR